MSGGKPGHSAARQAMQFLLGTRFSEYRTDRTDDDFVLFLNERFNEQYPNLINKGYFTDVDDDTMRLGTFYYAGGIYYILRQWITEPINKTPQEVAVLMYHFLNVD